MRAKALEQGRAEGKAKGRVEGRMEGRAEGQAALLLKHMRVVASDAA